jgi:phosphate transport system permease protein
MMGFTALFAVPIGLGAAIYLEEYAPRNWLTRVIQTNIANLAGVPSIVYGLLGLALFVRALELERSVLAGSLTMALLVLPIIIIASQEALRAVPSSIREASYAVGATRAQTVFYQVVPSALPGMMTGIILALSRAIGETAPLIMIGALLFVPFTPSGPMDRFTVLPIQIFNWASRPQEAFQENAAAAIIVLLAVLLTMNSIAIIVRNRFQRAHRG